MRILFVGDVFGKCGRRVCTYNLAGIEREHNIDFCILNGENATHGRGLSEEDAGTLLRAGADCITMGNHVWGQSQLENYIDDYPVLRPANLPKGMPGREWLSFSVGSHNVAVVNLIGRVAIESNADNPFFCIDRCLKEIKESGCDIIFIDFHAEASSEKIAMGYYVDGRVSCVVGTHTHVQTADERILEKGTAYITDAGMTGTDSGIIGMDKDAVMSKFVKGYGARFEPAEGSASLRGVIVEIEDTPGKDGLCRAKTIERIDYAEKQGGR